MTLKIVVLSPNQRHLADITDVLEGEGHGVVALAGGKSQLRAVAEREQPDVLIADGICCDHEELAQVEYVSTHYPQTAVVLMCSSHTPEYLLHAMRAGVREVLPSPVGADALRAALERIVAKLGRPKQSRAGEIVSFLACKGGAGATFLATNIAWELAQEGSVLLVDLNLQFGDALSFVHDGSPATTLADVTSEMRRLDASLLAASTTRITPSLSVLAAPQDPGQALEIQPEHIDAVLSLAARHYDHVLVDLPRSLNTTTIKVLDRSTKVFPVLGPSVPAVRHAIKLRQAFESLGYPASKLQFVVNAYERAADVGLEQVQRSLGVPVRVLVHGGSAVAASINRGEPLLQMARTSPLGRQLVELARTLNPQPEEQKTLLGRIFRRA